MRSNTVVNSENQQASNKLERLREQQLKDLEDALAQELEVVIELRDALARQRAGVASDDAKVIDESVHQVSRSLLTLNEARRRRGDLLEALTGDAGVNLEQLGQILGRPLPESLAAVRTRLRKMAQEAAREASISKRQRDKAIRVAKVPEDQFEAAVDTLAPLRRGFFLCNAKIRAGYEVFINSSEIPFIACSTKTIL